MDTFSLWIIGSVCTIGLLYTMIDMDEPFDEYSIISRKKHKKHKKHKKYTF